VNVFGLLDGTYCTCWANLNPNPVWTFIKPGNLGFIKRSGFAIASGEGQTEWSSHSYKMLPYFMLPKFLLRAGDLFNIYTLV
jgi:hypothetical protein